MHRQPTTQWRKITLGLVDSKAKKPSTHYCRPLSFELRALLDIISRVSQRPFLAPHHVTAYD
ncbi:MAG: hypothetical protein BYD32DRAFT_430220 [Podila humilis]|nr:MAG: hypothetical protein BYD32DRAFT_430220 [Podila humilis]